MLCERCGKKQATVYYTEVVNSEHKNIRLCGDCFRKMQPGGLGFLPQMNLHQFLGGFWNSISGLQKPVSTTAGADSMSPCPTCGTPESYFIQKGLFGCNDCYRHFEDRLEPLVRRIHGSCAHTGKIPERTGDRARLVRQVEELKAALKQAVAQEEFEKAAELRDSIKELGHRLQGGD